MLQHDTLAVMARKLVKDMEPKERAEHVLRKRLAKERRYYGILPKVKAVKYLGVEDGCHIFEVEHERALRPYFYGVKLYSKSARVYEW